MAQEDNAVDSNKPVTPRGFQTPPSRLGKRSRASPLESPSAQLHPNIKSATRRVSGHHQSPLSAGHLQESTLLVEFEQQNLRYNQDITTRLDNESRAKAEDHNAALASAAAEHNRVRLDAERAQRRAQLRHERERIDLEEEEQQELYRQQHETVEREIAVKRRELEEQRNLEERRRAAAAIYAQAEAEKEASLRRAKEDAETARKAAIERAEDERRARVAASIAHDESLTKKDFTKSPAPQQAKPTLDTLPTNPSAVPQTTGAGLVTDMAHRQAVHTRYRALHQQLKELRKFVVGQSKSNPPVKTRLVEMRREIRKCVSQLTVGKGANKTPIAAIRAILLEASRMSEPSVDVRPYIVDLPAEAAATTTDPAAASAAAFQFPAILLYQLNILSKAIISQFISEASVAPEAADAAGVLAVSIFAAPDFQWQRSVSLFDILLAKFHVVCPVLFGISGSDRTEAGRRRLGWWREDGGARSAWVNEQKHSERMTGLGAGFAALSLRDFRASKNANPFPPARYWQALARITNTPAADATETHYVVLKAMLERHADKLLAFFGRPASVAALRRAIVEFTRDAPQASVAAGGLRTLRVTLQRELGLVI